MRRYVLGVSGAVVGAALIVTPLLVLAASISNGSFETGTNPGVFITVTAPNSTTIPGWTVAAGSVDYIGTYWQASNGSRSLDLTGYSPGTITQTFPTTIGTTYGVTFDMSGNPAGGPSLKQMTVSATGGAPQTYSYDTAANGNTLANMKWQQQGYTFVATAANTTLSFTSLIAGFYGPALDNVAIYTVATNKDQCKDGGWQSLARADGSTFKNQGDCIQYVNTGK